MTTYKLRRQGCATLEESLRGALVILIFHQIKSPFFKTRSEPFRLPAHGIVNGNRRSIVTAERRTS